MDPEKQAMKVEYTEGSPSTHNGYLVASPLQVVHSMPKYLNSFPPILLQSQPVSQSSDNPCLLADNPQRLHPCALVVNDANTFRNMSNSAISDSGRTMQVDNSSIHFPNSSNSPASELGKIVRPPSPTQQCRIQEADMDHIGHILMEATANDDVASGSICALSAKTLYLSNSGAVISTIDLPYYWCNFCTFKTEQKLILLKHLMSHRFWCKWCRYQAYNRADVVRHCMAEHPQYCKEDLKFCVLLPDFLHSKVESEKTCDAHQDSNERKNLPDSEPCEPDERVQDTTEKEDKENTQFAPQTMKIKDVLEFLTGTTCNDSLETDKEKPTVKSRTETKNCHRKRSHGDNQESSEKVKKTEKASESQAVKKPNSPSVCFECCTCYFRTLRKELMEHHQAEVNHYKTDKTTGKKSFVLKIVNSSEKLKVETSDKEWLSEREFTGRSKRRNKSRYCRPIVTNDDYDDFHNFNTSDLDDENDEDYDPDKDDGKKKGSTLKKKKLAHSYKRNCEISNVDIEIDTAAEPSADMSVTSFSISCVNTVDSGHTFKISPKKIVTRNLYQNCIVKDPSVTQCERIVPLAIKKETDTTSCTLSNIRPSSPECNTSLLSNPLETPLHIQRRSEILTMPVTSAFVKAVPALHVSSSNSVLHTMLTTINTQPLSHVSVGSVNTEPFCRAETTRTVPVATTTTMPVKITAANGDNISVPTPALATVTIAPKTPVINSTVASQTQTFIASASAAEKASEASTSSENAEQEAVAVNSRVNINKKGVFKCAHCRVIADRVQQIRRHILDKHKDNPLYCLDMEATDGVSPRYLLFCHFKDCMFCTKNRNEFLSHVDKCRYDKGDKSSESEKKFKEVNLKFVKFTFPKLMKIAK